MLVIKTLLVVLFGPLATAWMRRRWLSLLAILLTYAALMLFIEGVTSQYFLSLGRAEKGQPAWDCIGDPCSIPNPLFIGRFFFYQLIGNSCVGLLFLAVGVWSRLRRKRTPETQ